MSVINTSSFGRFYPVSWTITPCFGVPEWFPCLTNPVVRLCVGHERWQFWPILARFMDYYSMFWGAGVVSMLNESCGAFTCRSSTLAVLPILARFIDYYSRFWGPGVVSMLNEPCGAFTCRSSTLQFWPILARFMDYYSLFWGAGVVSMLNEPCGAFMSRSSTLAVFADSGPFHGLLLPVLGSRSGFHA